MIANEDELQAFLRSVEDNLDACGLREVGFRYDVSLSRTPDIEVEIVFHSPTEDYYDILESFIDDPSNHRTKLQWIVEEARKILARYMEDDAFGD